MVNGLFHRKMIIIIHVEMKRKKKEVQKLYLYIPEGYISKLAIAVLSGLETAITSYQLILSSYIWSLHASSKL